MNSRVLKVFFFLQLIAVYTENFGARKENTLRRSKSVDDLKKIVTTDEADIVSKAKKSKGVEESINYNIYNKTSLSPKFNVLSKEQEEKDVLIYHNKDLTAKLGDKKIKITELKTTIKKKLKGYEKILMEKNDEIDKRIIGFNELQKNYHIILENYNNLKEDNMYLEYLNTEFQNEIPKLLQNYNDSQEFCRKLLSEKKILENENKKINKEKVESDTLYAEALDKIDNLENEKQEIAKEKAKISLNLELKDSEITSLKDKIKNYNEEIRSISQKPEKNQLNLQETSKKNKEENNSMSHIKIVPEIYFKLENKEKEIQELCQKIITLNDSLSKSEKLNQSLNNDIIALKGIRSKLENEGKQLETHVQTLEKQIQALQNNQNNGNDDGEKIINQIEYQLVTPTWVKFLIGGLGLVTTLLLYEKIYKYKEYRAKEAA